MSKRVQVIINPTAGQDQPILGVLNRVFHDSGIAWDGSITNTAGDARRFAQAAVAAGVDVVAAYGGDGTVMEVHRAVEIIDQYDANTQRLKLGEHPLERRPIPAPAAHPIVDVDAHNRPALRLGMRAAALLLVGQTVAVRVFLADAHVDRDKQTNCQKSRSVRRMPHRMPLPRTMIQRRSTASTAGLNLNQIRIAPRLGIEYTRPISNNITAFPAVLIHSTRYHSPRRKQHCRCSAVALAVGCAAARPSDHRG
jgi:Diacylglycerol kinase catalytic domain